MTTSLWQQYGRDSSLQHQIALRSTQGNLSWQALAAEINARAVLFRQQGVGMGTGVGLCGKNSLEFVLAYLAVLQLQGRVLGINPAFSPEKIQRICQDNQIAFLFHEETGLVPTGEGKTCSPLFHSLTLTLTSGSSGNPKAVVHNIKAHLDNAQGVCRLMAFNEQDTWLLSLPLFHVSGQGILWRWLSCHGILMLPGEDFYGSVLEATHVSLVPTQLQRMFAYIEMQQCLSWRTQHILLGGTHIPIALTQKLSQLNIQSYSGYGMTEMASTVCAKKSDEHVGVGQPLLGRELRLVDEEIWLKGAGLGLGYWQNGAVVPFTNSEGWLQTRDKGIWVNGELVIIGRLDNQFISGGENIQPEEIEALLQQYPTVKQAFVLPVDDVEFGQRPVAMVQFSGDFSTAQVTELRSWIAEKIEKFKQPIAYYPLPIQAQHGIKISRVMLKQALVQLLRKDE
ncbi:o-succinylbenzoate--CoA ligase [Conservatibacter flavescens]|uniref:O-succinylbenzoate--CoA ligase n=2 Tax=Conservatibacter flavescens TaxID=28161 RepID=A0A2M8S3Z3_9PAST|nr:o-succinylbenzoate--CoA ligase [Conservatibacter flavescens]